MATQPYNSLGQILEAGGDIALAKAISQGWSKSQIGDLRASKFPGLSDQDFGELLGIAQQSAKAARLAWQRGLTADELREITPINSGLYGGEYEGRRSRGSFEAVTVDGESWMSIVLDFPDVIDPTQMLILARERMYQIYSKYPGDFPDVEIEGPGDIGVIITSFTRAF